MSLEYGGQPGGHRLLEVTVSSCCRQRIILGKF